MDSRSAPLLIAAGLLLCAGVGAQEQGGDESAIWRLEMANDIVFGSDNQFTNGFAVQKHGPAASSLDAARGTPAFGRRLARVFLPSGDGLNYREAWAIGHNMQTPDDIENPALILDDLPYVGMLAWQNSFIAFDDQRMAGFGWMFGIVGESAFAEEVQDLVHSVISADEPLGWDNQLDDEPILGFFYTRKRKLWRNPGFDGAFAFGAAASNFLSYGDLGLEMRFGRIPEGFAYVPDAIGTGLHQYAMIPAKTRSSFYVTLILRARGLLVNMPREGNNFTDTNPWTEGNTLDPEDAIGQVFVGINYERPKWALRFHFFSTTDSVDTATLATNEDPENSGGTITYEWRFGD